MTSQKKFLLRKNFDLSILWLSIEKQAYAQNLNRLWKWGHFNKAWVWRHYDDDINSKLFWWTPTHMPYLVFP